MGFLLLFHDLVYLLVDGEESLKNTFEGLLNLKVALEGYVRAERLGLLGAGVRVGDVAEEGFDVDAEGFLAGGNVERRLVAKGKGVLGKLFAKCRSLNVTEVPLALARSSKPVNAHGDT